MKRLATMKGFAWSIPLSYFVDRKREFVGKVNGYRTWNSEEARLFFRELLQQKH